MTKLTSLSSSLHPQPGTCQAGGSNPPPFSVYGWHSIQAQDMSADAQRADEEVKALKKERDALEAELATLSKAYRKKIILIVEKVGL